jgi:hypothetical protein
MHASMSSNFPRKRATPGDQASLPSLTKRLDCPRTPSTVHAQVVLYITAASVSVHHNAQRAFGSSTIHILYNIHKSVVRAIHQAHLCVVVVAEHSEQSTCSHVQQGSPDSCGAAEGQLAQPLLQFCPARPRAGSRFQGDCTDSRKTADSSRMTRKTASNHRLCAPAARAYPAGAFLFVRRTDMFVRAAASHRQIWLPALGGDDTAPQARSVESGAAVAAGHTTTSTVARRCLDLCSVRMWCGDHANAVVCTSTKHFHFHLYRLGRLAFEPGVKERSHGDT